MRKMILLIIGIAASISQGETKNVKPPITICPRVRFSGDHTAQIATAIFAETLQDIRNKIENGDNEMFPAGFFHTSTEPEGVPEYYNDMWSRDCGRGVIELARLGFSEETKSISRYFCHILPLKIIGDGNFIKRHLSKCQKSWMEMRLYCPPYVGHGESMDEARSWEQNFVTE